MLKKILLVTAIFEAATGILLIALPVLTSSLLLGEESLGIVAITIVRITGVALITLGIICWVSRQKENALNIVKALIFYNVTVTSVLIYGKLALHLPGIGLLPVIVLHLVLAIWGIVSIQKK